MINYDKKRLASRAFLIYALANVFAYALAHVTYLFQNDVMGELFEYVSYYVSKSMEFLAPPTIATLAYLVYLTESAKGSILFTLKLSLARLFYSIPYYYLIFIYNYAYDSIESITLSLLASALVILVTVLGAFICIGAYSLILKHCGYDKKDFLKVKEPMDFLSSANLAVMVFALLRFAFSLLKEIYDTVVFFIEYRSDYTAEEIITILVNFTLLFLLLIASYLLATSVKNKIAKNQHTDPESDQA